MTATISLSVPKMFAPLTSEPESKRAIEHARLNCRIVETVAGLAVQAWAAGRSVVIFAGSESQRANHVLNTLVGQIGAKVVRFSSQGISSEYKSFRLPSGAELWLASGDTFYKEELPWTRVDQVFGIGCHAINTDITTLIPDAIVTLAGELAERTHWFYEYARQTPDIHRFDAEAITTVWPDQKNRILPKNDPFYERAMLLQDVEPKFTTSAFFSFARRRLKVRTDKVLDHLDQRQREEGRAQYGTPVVTMEPTAFQRKYAAKKRWWKRQGKRFVIVIKYRRGGITTWEQGESYAICAERPRSDCITLAHTTKSTRRIFRIAKLFHEKDPAKPQLINPSKTALEFSNGSYFFIGTAGGTGEARGDTLVKFHGSEVSKWCRGPHQMEQVADLVAGLTGAAEHGEGVLETTPDGREWICNEYEQAKLGNSLFGYIFVRWFDDPLNRCKDGTFDPQEILQTLTDEEKDLVCRYNLSLAQIAYRREKKKQYKSLFPQEMPEDDKTCFLTGGHGFFDNQAILDILGLLPDDSAMKQHIPGGYEIRWKAPVKGRRYCAGVDTSEGVSGGDPNGVGVLDKESGEQVAAIHGLFKPTLLAEHAVRLCTEYNRALLGIERENHGHAVIQKVLELGYSKPHFRGGPLYYYDQKGDIDKSRAGWSTNPQSRPIMLNDLYDAMDDDEGGMIVHDRDFLGECLTFRLQSDGKFGADPGAHDDTVMKWAVAWQMRKYHVAKPGITILGAEAN